MNKKRDYSKFPKICKALGRWPDRVIGENIDPYLLRWHLIPKNPVFNIYLHKFVRSDDDRALHDHPWSWNVSLILNGEYIEYMPFDRKTFGKLRNHAPPFSTVDMRLKTKLRRAWRPVFRRGTTPHRVELIKDYRPFIPRWGMSFIEERPVWTIFITGRTVREWGFYCPHGWRFWKSFVSERDGGNGIGKGCE